MSSVKDNVTFTKNDYFELTKQLENEILNTLITQL